MLSLSSRIAIDDVSNTISILDINIYQLAIAPIESTFLDFQFYDFLHRPYTSIPTYSCIPTAYNTYSTYLLHTIVSEHTHCAAEIPSIKIGSKVVDSEAPRLSAGGCVLSSLLSSFFTSRILGTLFVHIPSSHRHTSTYRKVGCEVNIGK